MKTVRLGTLAPRGISLVLIVWRHHGPMEIDAHHQDDGLAAPRTARDALALAGLAILFSLIGLLTLLQIAPG